MCLWARYVSIRRFLGIVYLFCSASEVHHVHALSYCRRRRPPNICAALRISFPGPEWQRAPVRHVRGSSVSVLENRLTSSSPMSSARMPLKLRREPSLRESRGCTRARLRGTCRSAPCPPQRRLCAPVSFVVRAVRRRQPYTTELCPCMSAQSDVHAWVVPTSCRRWFVSDCRLGGNVDRSGFVSA